MPLIRIDHNTNDIDKALCKQLVKELLAFAMELHGMNQDQISIFTSDYTEESHSTAAAEVEIRAKKNMYGENPDEQREAHLEAYEKLFRDFMDNNKIKKGIVLTLTLEDWSVKFISN